jgi:hypothetical protein
MAGILGTRGTEPYNTQIDGQTVGARQKDTVENYIHNAICFNVPGHKSHGTAAQISGIPKINRDECLRVDPRRQIDAILSASLSGYQPAPPKRK